MVAPSLCLCQGVTRTHTLGELVSADGMELAERPKGMLLRLVLVGGIELERAQLSAEHGARQGRAPRHLSFSN